MSKPSQTSQNLVLSLGLTGALASCAPDSAQAPERQVTEPHVSARASEEIDPILTAARARLLASRVTDADFARGVLYTWTTREQIADLMTETDAQGARFLTRSRMRNGEPGLFARALAHLDGVGPDVVFDHAARLLLSNGAFRNRRFAWPTPWATRLGLGRNEYGDQLVRVELAPNAIIARLVVRSRGEALTTEPIRFVDLAQRPVRFEEVQRDPQRLAAVFHVHIQEDLGVALREYVLLNESSIASVTFGTDELRTMLAEDAQLARSAKRLIGGAVRSLAGDGVIAAQEAALASPSDDLPTAYRASLAFATPSYVPDADTMHRLASALDASVAAFPTNAMRLEPRRRFVLAQPSQPAAPAASRWNGPGLWTS